MEEDKEIKNEVTASGEPKEEIKNEVSPSPTSENLVVENKSEMANSEVAKPQETVKQEEKVIQTNFFENKVDDEIPAGDKKLAETETKEIKKETEDNKEDKLDYKSILTVLAVIVIVAMGIIWYSEKGNNGPNSSSTDSNVKITVDGNQEQGKVNITEDNSSKITGENGQVVGSTQTTPIASTQDPNKIKITAYYPNQQKNPSAQDCSLVYPLERVVEKKYDSDLVNITRGLLLTLTNEEKAQGFLSNIPAGTMLKKILMDKQGIVEVYLTETLNRAAGSCAVTSIRSQIETTLKQFPFVKTVVICVGDNCKPDEILQP